MEECFLEESLFDSMTSLKMKMITNSDEHFDIVNLDNSMNDVNGDPKDIKNDKKDLKIKMKMGKSKNLI